MRRWGIVVSGFYVATLLLFLHPLGMSLVAKEGLRGLIPNSLSDLANIPAEFGKALAGLAGIPVWWTWILMLVCGQALLLFLSVDTSWRRFRPRQHVAVTAALAGGLSALLAFAVIWCLAVGIGGDKVLDWPYSPMKGSEARVQIAIAAWWAGLWVVWSIVFYLYYRGSSAIVATAVSWLLRGSVLELLIAIPAHIVVRHRNDCSAPIVTSWGIITGIAIMLLCFGPSVLALYKKRLEAYSRNRGA